MKSIEKIDVKKWLLILLILILIGLLNFGVIITKTMSYSESLKWVPPVVDELSGTITIIFLMPFLFKLFNRYPLKKENLIIRVPLYIAASMVYGFIHTNLMTISRELLYGLLNLGEYNPGNYLYRLLMEYQKQFIVFWIIYFIHFFIKSNREKQQEKLKASDLQKKLTEAQLQNLQNQLNPHFLFNTLSMISSEMYGDPQKADTMITNLSDLLRLSLKEKPDQKHSLLDEKSLTEIYINIMRARFNDKLRINWHISTDAGKALVPRFLLQPLIENSIKHGFKEKESLEVRISAEKIADVLELKVIDNGPGIKKSSGESTGVGLINIKERLAKIYDSADVGINNLEPSGTEIKIIIPFETS